MSLNWRICNNNLHEAELMWIGEDEYKGESASIFITDDKISVVYNADGDTHLENFERGKNLKEIESYLKERMGI